jgi:ATP-dependent Clp protease ATP-binding subunit ClpC
LPIDDILDKSVDLVDLSSGAGTELEEELSKPDFFTIDRFCKNLSQIYGQESPKVFGRSKEITNVLNILCRHKKGNVLLIGDAGVGRKSIIRGAIEKINLGKSSEVLRDKTFYQLDVTAMVAGTSMFGAIENRFKTLADELEKHKDAVLVIPDFHAVSGGGSKDGSGDVSGFIKAILNRPNISCVATTTQVDYKKYVERDQSMSNLFEVVKVEEPNKEDVREILINSIQELEDCHYVDFSPESIDTVLDLCEKFLPYRRFPEKAFDTLDFIGAQTKNVHFTHPPKLHSEWENIVKKISPALVHGSPEFIALNKRMDKWAKKLNKWMDKTDKNIPLISSEYVITAFAEKYKISENQLKQLQSSGIDGLAEKLKTVIFGQDEAIDKVCDVLLCSKVGLRDKNKPLGKFMFVGSTSTGKSELSKQLAFGYFGDDKALLKLDMSEFSEKFSASSLIGTTAGYIGYENGGRLTEFVKHTPSCVVLFDEVEKADRSIHNLLLQIMDDGYLTDGQGFRVDFTNTIIVLTTNSGSEPPKSLGFNAQPSSDHHEKATKKDFAPEFRARVDEVVVFNDMSDKMMASILDKFIAQSIEKLKTSGISTIIEDSVRHILLKEIESQSAHSREIQTTVRRKLDIPLAKFIIDKRPKTIIVKAENNKIEIS